MGAARSRDHAFRENLSRGRLKVLVQQPDRESPPGIGRGEIVAQLVKTGAIGLIQQSDVGGVMSRNVA